MKFGEDASLLSFVRMFYIDVYSLRTKHYINGQEFTRCIKSHTNCDVYTVLPRIINIERHESLSNIMTGNISCY